MTTRTKEQYIKQLWRETVDIMFAKEIEISNVFEKEDSFAVVAFLPHKCELFVKGVDGETVEIAGEINIDSLYRSTFNILENWVTPENFQEWFSNSLKELLKDSRKILMITEAGDRVETKLIYREVEHLSSISDYLDSLETFLNVLSYSLIKEARKKEMLYSNDGRAVIEIRDITDVMLTVEPGEWCTVFDDDSKIQVVSRLRNKYCLEIVNSPVMSETIRVDVVVQNTCKYTLDFRIPLTKLRTIPEKYGVRIETLADFLKFAASVKESTPHGLENEGYTCSVVICGGFESSYLLIQYRPPHAAAEWPQIKACVNWLFEQFYQRIADACEGENK